MMKKYWCDNSAVWTHYGNASSIIFPAWEKAFVAIVQSYMDDVTDADLKSRMVQFVKEETAHSKAHEDFNLRHGLKEAEEDEYKNTKLLHRKPKLRFWLGTMVSIEHLASCMGRSYLDRWSDRKSKDFKLFCYHAKEELGHKKLALDLWDYLGYDRKELRKIAAVNQKYVIGFLLKYTIQKVKEDGLLYKLSTIIDMIDCFSYIGIKIVIPGLRIYRKDFDPDDIDDSKYFS